ncbi:glycoside hydrolase family 16 protein [Rubinisphaera margarita]|uniref:glycoside hydrolase family 16 protein n=1 Tax=Rubinisphaera margarita TaxID=2909586 RepID=UPI001EE87E20|nr:glycoside hydrolase family 16 protein [Rubinisphaera margarita]MCG6158284.1 glycoside hydrolase family 16 protein [Rubinisphaera margarita]
MQLKLTPLAAVAVIVLSAQGMRAAPPESPADHAQSNITRVPDFEEDWSSGQIDPQKWYLLRKKWGHGNNGVVPENVRIEQDLVAGESQNVLVCEGHGDHYSGDVIGFQGRRERVGGVIVSKRFFASGRFEVVMKVGDSKSFRGGPQNPAHPQGAIPAIWTFAYRWVEGDPNLKNEFIAGTPLYNPHMPAYGIAANEYWSEIDFPEFGKGGDFTRGLYNTFCNSKHDPNLFDVSEATDGQYHVFTTEWTTQLNPLPDLTDRQVVEHEGYWWIRDKSVPFETYLGNPLKKLGPDNYALYCGDKVSHWIDGRYVATHTRYVPAMAAQLNLGIWLPEWAGPAPWETATVSVASVRIWQFENSGDVHGVLVDDIANNFREDGSPLPNP